LLLVLRGAVMVLTPFDQGGGLRAGAAEGC
jgi:hypothetical protein